jgi:hypothetical protein
MSRFAVDVEYRGKTSRIPAHCLSDFALDILKSFVEVDEGGVAVALSGYSARATIEVRTFYLINDQIICSKRE